MSKHSTSFDDSGLYLSSSQIADVWLDDNEYGKAILHGVANHFQNRMMASNWPTIAQTVRDAPTKGLSAQAGETTLRTFLMAGRLMITLARGEQQITFLAYEHDDNDWWGGAIQSIEAPLSVALAMIDDVTANPVQLTADDAVTIGL